MPAFARHSAALAVTAILNAALVCFLITWQSGGEAPEPAPVRTVPLEVVEPEVEHTELARPEPADAVTPSEPAEPAPLPPPPVPAIPLPEFRAAMPRLDLPAAVSVSADLPLYAAREMPPTPVPTAPRIRPVVQAPRVGTDRGPVLADPPDLSAYYPRRARLRGTTGTSSVRVTIDTQGSVTGVEVLHSTPAGVFDRAARRVARSLRFQPAQRGGRPVPVAVSFNLIWRLE